MLIPQLKSTTVDTGCLKQEEMGSQPYYLKKIFSFPSNMFMHLLIL